MYFPYASVFTWNRTCAVAVRSQRLATLALGGPASYSCFIMLLRASVQCFLEIPGSHTA